MTAEEFEKAISTADENLLSPQNREALGKTEHPFFKKYLHSTPRVKSMLISVLKLINQPWCFKYYLEAMRDPDGGLRNNAAQGIVFLRESIDEMRVISEIARLNAGDPEERLSGMTSLVLAAGNSRNPKVIEPLLTFFQVETNPNVQRALQKALAKVGFPKAIREIEMELSVSDGYGKGKALGKVDYIDSPTWIEKVKPLLLDEAIGWSIPFGPGRISRRVCDLAVNTLRAIDPEKKILFPEQSYGIKYNPEEMAQARKAYGVLPQK